MHAFSKWERNSSQNKFSGLINYSQIFTILNTIESMDRIELRIGKPLLHQTFHEIVIFISPFFYNVSLSPLSLSQQAEYQFSHEIRVSRRLFRGIYGTRRDYETDVLRRRESKLERTIMTGCKAKFIARLLCPRSLNRRNSNVKGLRYSFGSANLFSLSLDLIRSIAYRMRTESYLPESKSARENEFRGNRKCTGPAPSVLSRYFDYSWLLKAPRARIPVIKQRDEHVDVGAANVKIETLLEICRIVRRSLILAPVLSLIYPVISFLVAFNWLSRCNYII